MATKGRILETVEKSKQQRPFVTYSLYETDFL